MGMKFTVPGVTFGGPKLQPDAILPDAGALLLIEPGHGAGGWPDLAEGSTPVANVAAKQAQALTGATLDALRATLVTTGLSGTNGLLEFTEKGGLHSIIKQSSALGGNYGVSIRPPLAVAEYVLAHPDHSYYISFWVKVTRKALNTSQYMLWQYESSGVSEYLALASRFSVSVNPTSGARSLGHRNVGNAQNAGSFANGTDVVRALGVAGYTGTPSTTAAAALGAVLFLYTNGAMGTYGTFSGNPSEIFYRFYMEDLTESGRTFAAVSAIDTVLHDAAFDDGGKYHGDTYTNPTTIP